VIRVRQGRANLEAAANRIKVPPVLGVERVGRVAKLVSPEFLEASRAALAQARPEQVRARALAVGQRARAVPARPAAVALVAPVFRVRVPARQEPERRQAAARAPVAAVLGVPAVERQPDGKSAFVL
jgi:hypothetical protein